MQYETIPQVSYKIIDNEVFVLNRATGIIHSFNGTGNFLFVLIGKNTPFGDLATALAKEYEIALPEAGRDVIAFLKELATKGLVLLHDD
jgi:hypothetical protein